MLNANGLIATVEWSPTQADQRLSKNHSPTNSDEGCYGSSDMSAESIDTVPSSLLPHQQSFCGVYRLNMKNSIDDDIDSVLQNNELILSAKHHLKTQIPALERFEKIYYSSENRCNYEIRGSFV